jgi:predicted branched-subunit amino acid permease
MPFSTVTPERRAEYARGARDITASMPGTMAWGLVTGVAMAKSGLTIEWSLVMTFSAFAGAAQLAALPLIAGAAPVWIIVFTALLTNLRFVIYSAALSGTFGQYSARRRTLLGYLTGDFAFVTFMNRIAADGQFAHRDAYFLGMCSFNWLGWQVASIAGLVGGAYVPLDWGLEFAGTLALLALLVPLCKQRPGLVGAAVAAAVAVLGHAWPYKLGMLAGMGAGLVCVLLSRDETSADL